MEERQCLVCKKKIWIKASYIQRGWGKYCSKRCQAKAQRNGQWLHCDYCEKLIYRTPKDFVRSESKKFFCSVGCHCAWENKNRRSGENAPNWIAGQRVYKNLLIRAGIKRICGQCRLRDERVLVAHHRDRNRRNNRLDNLEWLCMNCHYLEHLRK
ncbi:MAG: HNH endonuclease [Candidatus Vogelbacteria bacterium]|nr:HNH endonuclease [Candidatus Vogelbacteria bacterium]